MPLLALLALVIGAVLPLQAGINAQLRNALGHPVTTALVSFLVGTLALAVVCLVLRVPVPTSAALSRSAGWHWTGGLLGAAYIAAAVVLAPRLGATALVALVVTGQLVASLALDHFGWVGYPQRPVDVPRLLGVALLVAGVLLVQRR
ncbi:MAG TPA: DMT family transporter [Aggregicoccus sp.]|nr:DMT family transporter [Aggregicoccus sp.]